MKHSTCIYCKAQDRPFDREHIIPKAFGTFEQNLVLHDCVCAGCNSYFSRELELHLGRDSAEALLRLRYGLKPVSEARQLLNERVRLRIREQGPWFGARFIRVPDTTGTKLEPERVPQVGFRKKLDGEWVWLSEGELQNPDAVEPYRKNCEIRIAGPSAEALGQLENRLKELGIDFQRQGVLDDPIANGSSIQAELESRIDEVIFRGIGKIAFNYLAFVRGADFVLRSDFDPFRRFVRYGESPGWLPVYADTMPILHGDTSRWRQTNGHIVVFDWQKGSDGIVAYVSLFNSITYHALLCEKYSGVWHPIASGCHFDIETSTISEVRSITLL